MEIIGYRFAKKIVGISPAVVISAVKVWFASVVPDGITVTLQDFVRSRSRPNRPFSFVVVVIVVESFATATTIAPATGEAGVAESLTVPVTFP
jgi:hypothetical protein